MPAEPIRPPPMVCCYCLSDRDVIRVGLLWHCPICGANWLAFDFNDRRFLKMLHIAPQE